MGGRSPFSCGWLALAVIFAACFPAPAAAGEIPYHNSKTVTNVRDWLGQDVKVEVDGTTTANIVVEVTGNTHKAPDPITGAITEKAGDLTITASNKYAYSAEVVFNNGNNKAAMDVIFDSVDLSGYQLPKDSKTGTTTTATLTVKGPNSTNVWVVGETKIGESSRLAVDGAGNSFRTGTLTMAGAGTGKAPHDATATITNGGLLYVQGQADILENAKLRVDTGGTAMFNDAAYVGGTSSKGNAVVELDGGNIVFSEADSDKKIPGGSLTVGDGGKLLITGAGTSKISQNNTDADSKGVDLVGGGRLVVDSGATLEIDMLRVASQNANPDDPADPAGPAGALINGTVNAKWFRAYGDGIVDVNGTLGVDDMDITGNSIVNVNDKGTLGEFTPGGPDNVITVSGGTLNIESGGTVAHPKLYASSGVINIKAGGTSSVADFEAAGTSDVNVSGTIAAGTSFKVNGVATVKFSGGSKIGDGGNLAHLGVGGDGTLDIASSVTADSFSFGGGTINMTGGNLTAEATGAPFNMLGDLNFKSDTSIAAFKGDVTFTRGGIHALNNVTGHMRLNDGGTHHTLEIGRQAVLDTESGSMLIDGVSNFILDGTLNVGYQNGQVLMADIKGIAAAGGSLDVDSKATVTMTNAMQRQALASVNSGGLLVLKTDAGVSIGADAIYWDTDSILYEYQVVKDPVTGQYGIWVKGAQAASRDTLYNNIIENWREHPKIGDYVNNVINQSMLDAIVDANYLAIGIEPGYDTLNPSGQFNADLLSSLVSPKQSGAGYDALMLYNGSGLNMANQAVVSSNARILRGINRRTEDLRREIRGNDQIDPDSEMPDPLPANRFWGDIIYLSESSGHDRGIGGYSLRGMGLTVGHDRMYGDLAVGAAVSYLGGHFRDASALSNNSRIDTFAADLYATLTHPSGWFVSGTIGYGYSDNQIRDMRILNGFQGWNHADYGSHSLATSLVIGHDLWVGDAWTLSPSIGIDYVGTRSGSHTQYFTGNNRAGGANTLLAGQIKNHSASIPLNLSLSYNMPGEDGSLLTLTGDVGYAYELNNDGASGNIDYDGLNGHVGSVKIARRSPGQHLFNIGLRGKYYFRQYEVGMGYDYVGKRKYNAHTLTLNAGVSF